MDDHNINHWINMQSSIYQNVKMDPRLLEKNWIFNFKVSFVLIFKSELDTKKTP